MVYGAGHEPERKDALRGLIRLNDEDPHKWSEADVYAVWEELIWGWWGNLRQLLRSTLLGLGNQNPSVETCQ